MPIGSNGRFVKAKGAWRLRTKAITQQRQTGAHGASLAFAFDVPCDSVALAYKAHSMPLKRALAALYRR